jgi:histidyl-tRNA synthetase
LGEDELKDGKVRIKELGLRDGHPEKEGVLVSLPEVVAEVQKRLKRKLELDQIAMDATGLKVTGGSTEEPSEEATKTGVSGLSLEE